MWKMLQNQEYKFRLLKLAVERLNSYDKVIESIANEYGIELHFDKNLIEKIQRRQIEMQMSLGKISNIVR